ncbi:MAG: hypothetical protein ACLP5V_00655 [Candidatus Bathyarchaeia archaeon]
MITEKDAVHNAIAAFTTLHAEAQYRAGVRALDRGELNLYDMKCVQREDGTWICTLPHIHLPLLNLIYEFSYSVKDDFRKAEYSCKNTTVPESNK